MFIQLLIGLTLIASLGTAQATELDTFFFETDWGEEVRVSVSGTYADPDYTFYSQSGNDGHQVFYQYVQAALNNQAYRYEVDLGCGVECHDPQTLPGAETNTKVSGTTLFKKAISNKNDLAKKVVEGAATQAGSRAVDAVVDQITQGGDVQSSPFTVVSNSNRKPTLMCKIVSGSCVTLPDVNFTGLDDGGFGVAYPEAGIGSEGFAYSNQIRLTLENFVRNYGYKCVTTYTGSGGDLVAQVVCFSSY